jgi:hypothetical protein
MLTSTPVIHNVARATTALTMITPEFNTIIHVQTLHNTTLYATRLQMLSHPTNTVDPSELKRGVELLKTRTGPSDS